VTPRYILYNGAGPPEDALPIPAGKLKEALLPTGSRLCDIAADREIPIILVQFDGEDDGDHPLNTAGYSVSNTMKRLIPICAQPGRSNIRGTGFIRWQIPLAPAHARTIHSSQGITALHGAVVDPGGDFFAGDYVAMSRVKLLSQLHLLAPVTKRYFQRKPAYRSQIDAEYARMEHAFPNPLPDDPPPV
jgi:hypothetical protein